MSIDEDWEGRVAAAWALIDDHEEAAFVALIDGLAAELPALADLHAFFSALTASDAWSLASSESASCRRAR